METFQTGVPTFADDLLSYRTVGGIFPHYFNAGSRILLHNGEGKYAINKAGRVTMALTALYFIAKKADVSVRTFSSTIKRLLDTRRNIVRKRSSSQLTCGSQDNSCKQLNNFQVSECQFGL